MTAKRVFEKKTYTSLDEYQGDWLSAFQQAGHSPEMQDGCVDAFAYNPVDPHNGPRCTKCGEGWCWHCTAPWQIAEEKCGGSDHRLAVEHAREDRTLSEAKAIRAKRRATPPTDKPGSSGAAEASETSS